MTSYRYIPKDSQAIEHALGVVYTYQAGARPAAIAYTGKANKSVFHNSYIGRDPEAQRQAAIDSFFRGLESSQASKLQRREEAKKAHTIPVGAIIHYSWGWEQTNCEFYEVVGATNNYVRLQRLNSAAAGGEGFMSQREVAVPGTAHGPVTTHRVNVWGSGQSVTFKYGSGSVWDGKPEYCSWYA